MAEAGMAAFGAAAGVAIALAVVRLNKGIFPLQHFSNFSLSFLVAKT
jgi:hypothetical protein